jgi:hypothetical protein
VKKPISARADVTERFTVLVRDWVEVEETIVVSSVMMGVDDEIVPLLGEENN